MSEGKVIPFEPQHLVGFDDIEGRLSTTDALREGEIHKKCGPSASFVHNGVIVLCGGIHIYWKGTGESWMCLRKGYVGPLVLKTAKLWLDEMIELHAIDRVAAILPIGEKWSRTETFLGFTYECTMRKYGPNGADKALWARVR